MNSGDIGDHSLNDLTPEPSYQQRLPPSSSSPFVQPLPFGPSSSGSPVGAASSSSTGSFRPQPPPLSPTRPTNGYSGGSSLGPTSPRSPRIPSSPSSSSLLSPTKGAPPMLLPPHLSPRKLSRSNSTPRLARQRAAGGLSQDLGVADIDRDKYQASLEERARQKRWVEAFAVVNFNLDVGPEVEKCVPDRRWGIGVAENIAFSSFPDTSLFNEGHITWSFKLNDPSRPFSPIGPYSAALPGASSSSEVSSRLFYPKTEDLDPNGGEGGGQQDGRLFGFVFFLQKRDGTIKRGYFQKSLVLLSPLPYPSLFTAIVTHLAPLFFTEGSKVLEAACREIADWPPPTSSASLQLPLLGSIFNAQLPSPNQSSQLAQSAAPLTSSASSSSSQYLHGISISRSASPFSSHVPPSSVDPRTQRILSSLPSTPPLKLLAKLIPSLWVIWECLILAEPILVIAPDPKTCSELIWWLRDFVRPLPPSGDLRPYFHIHDASFSLLVNLHQPPPGTVLGVTNPFFRQSCAHWPNILSIGERCDSSIPTHATTSSVTSPSPSSRRHASLSSRQALTSASGGAQQQQHNSGNSKVDHPDGFRSKRKRLVSKDRTLLKRLEEAVADGKAEDFAANEALRFHFADLTEKFLVPLNRYFTSLIPTDLTPDTFNRLPPLRPFSTTAFLTSLKSHGHPLLFRAKTPFGSGGSQTFYESFLKSPNFGVWLARRCGEAIRECEKRARVGGWTEDGSGVGREGGGGKGGRGLGLETGMEALAVGGPFNENDSRRSSSSNGLRAGRSSESSAVS